MKMRLIHVAKDSHPTWSPDDTQLAFVSDRDGNDEIYGSLGIRGVFRKT